MPFVLIGNKKDLYSSSEPDHVSLKAGKKVGSKIKAYTSLQCSSKLYGETNGTKGNVDKVFKAAIRSGLKRKGAVSSSCCTVL